MALTLVQTGTLATVQDGGRFGYQHLGLAPAGACDPFSLAQGNLLVGNEAGAAALEFNLDGGRARFEQPALIVLAGAEAEAWLDDTPLPPGSPALVATGTELRLGRFRRGARVYLCVAGGVAASVILASRSTHLSAGIGQPLVRGQSLPLIDTQLDLYPSLHRRWRESGSKVTVARWWAEGLWNRWRGGPLRLRLLPGPALAGLNEEGRRNLERGVFRVGPAWDRMGLRLEGPSLPLEHQSDDQPAPVAFGSVQRPSEHQLIALLAERQTTGGYPRIGEVISADLPLLAQLRPGDRLGFRPVDETEAHAALRRRVQALWRLGVGLRLRQR